MSSEDLSTPKPPKALWPVFVWSLLALVLFLVGTKALLSIPGPVQPEDAARSAERTKAWADLQTEDAAKLTTLAWADKAKGTVQLPIDLAMNLTVERLAGQSPRPVPAATPEPASATTEPVATPDPAATPETPSDQSNPSGQAAPAADAPAAEPTSN